MAITTIVHIDTVNLTDPNVEYIGRAMPSRGIAESPWANPFRVARGASGWESIAGCRVPLSRFAAVELFRCWASSAEDSKALWIYSRAHTLSGKTLACWCCGKDGIPPVITSEHPVPWVCHGQVLAWLAETIPAPLFTGNGT